MDTAQIKRDLQNLQILTSQIAQNLSKMTGPEIAALTADVPDLSLLLNQIQSPISPQRKFPEIALAQLLADNRRKTSLLDAIFDVDPSGLAVVVGPDITFTYANPAYRFLCPHNGKDIIGQPYNQVWLAEETECYSCEIREVLETGRPFLTLNYIRRFSDGDIRSFIMQSRRIDWDDRPATLIALWDITERKQIEETLAASEAKFRDLAESISDPFTAWDKDLRCIYRNKAAESSSNITSEQALGKTMVELFPTLDGSEVELAYRQVLETHQPLTIYSEWRHPQDGRNIYYEISLYPNRQGVSAFSKDITGKRKVEDDSAGE